MRELTNNDWSYIYSEFTEPFEAHEVGWKPQAFNKQDNTKALLVAYVDARVIADRLNSVVGPQNWQTEFTAVPNAGTDAKGNVYSGVNCRLTVFGVYKEDVGTPSMSDGLKGMYSDALKRAAVHFGLGRYLYELTPSWGQLDSYKKVVQPPELPDWALPGAKATPESMIFDLVRELSPYDSEEAPVFKTAAQYHPALTKLELREIYRTLKALKGKVITNGD